MNDILSPLTSDPSLAAFQLALDELVGVHAYVATQLRGKDPLDRLQFEHFERDIWNLARDREHQKRAVEIVNGSCPTPDDDPLLAFSALCQLPACGFGDMPVGQIVLAVLPMVCAILSKHFDEVPGDAEQA